MKKYLAIVENSGIQPYCMDYDAYFIQAKNMDDAKVLVNARYGKKPPHPDHVQIVQIETTRDRGIIAELTATYCE